MHPVQPRSEVGPKNRRGPRLGSGAPIGCVPVTRPRRDRVMGSSILASLSEAGGNDPRGLVSKPLPPHSLDPADRVERNPRPLSMQTNGPNRAVPLELNYAEFTGVSGPGRSPNALAACRSGNHRPTAESPSAGSRLQFRFTPNDIFSALFQKYSRYFAWNNLSRRASYSQPRQQYSFADSRHAGRLEIAGVWLIIADVHSMML
jgi:hypothetical protein